MSARPTTNGAARAPGGAGAIGISSASASARSTMMARRPSATRTTTICAGAGLAVASACAASSAVVACPSMVTTPVPVACPGRRRTSLSSTIRSTASRGKAYAPSPERQTNTLARPRASAGTDGRSPPEASTLRSSPHARTSRSSVAMLGDCCPRSIRATIAWRRPGPASQLALREPGVIACVPEELHAVRIPYPVRYRIGYQAGSGRGSGPTYAASGRIRRPCSACSSTCAHQPAVRATANAGV